MNMIFPGIFFRERERKEKILLYVTNQMARFLFGSYEKADSLQISITSNSETFIFLPVKSILNRSQ